MSTDIVLAITGASGAVYAVRLLDVLLAAGCRVHLSISPAGAAVIEQELELKLDLDRFQLDRLLPDVVQWTTAREFHMLRTLLGTPAPTASGRGDKVDDAPRPGQVVYHHYRNLLSRIASGSSRSAGMVICPCSGGTLSGIAHGTSSNLIQRAADVHLKERRKLILVPRETPLSLVQIDNLRRVAEAGAVVLPAMPGFYHGVHAIRDLVDFVVARICDHLQVEHHLIRRWGEDNE